MLLFLFIVCENNLSDKFQRHIVNNYKVIVFKYFK